MVAKKSGVQVDPTTHCVAVSFLSFGSLILQPITAQQQPHTHNHERTRTFRTICHSGRKKKVGATFD